MSDDDSSSHRSVSSFLKEAKRSLDDSNVPIDQRQRFISALAAFFGEDTDSFGIKLPRRDIPAWDAAIGSVRRYIERWPPGGSESSPGSDVEGNGSAGERLHQLVKEYTESPKRSFQSRVQNFASGLGLSTQSIIDDEKESGSGKPNVLEEEEEEEEEEALEHPDEDLVEIRLTRKQWAILQARIKEADEANTITIKDLQESDEDEVIAIQDIPESDEAETITIKDLPESDEAETITIKDLPESNEDEQKVTDTDEEPHQSGNEASGEGLGISD
jgi:hypothetical protein